MDKLKEIRCPLCGEMMILLEHSIKNDEWDYDSKIVPGYKTHSIQSTFLFGCHCSDIQVMIPLTRYINFFHDIKEEEVYYRGR